VPGLAKTLAVKTVAECLKITFSRIQFTPDLPCGRDRHDGLRQRSQEFYTQKGPHIRESRPRRRNQSRAAKVHRAARAMQEKQVTIGGETFFLGEPFLVLATANRSSTKGLSAARSPSWIAFMLKVGSGYPTRRRGEGNRGAHAGGRPIESSASPKRTTSSLRQRDRRAVSWIRRSSITSSTRSARS